MATLKISDLSVGDWLGMDQAELNVPSTDLASAYIEKLRKPIYVKGISEDSDMVIADIEIIDEWGSIMMKCEHLCPIPITAEILEKNGFEEDCGRWYNSEARMEFEQYEDGWCRTINCGEYSVYFIKYVHQLQHALRLAGVDKEINL